jgi:hypothetical protein
MLVVAENDAVTVKMSYTNANIFRIHHHYHMGDHGVKIQAPHDLDTKRVAVYIQFQAENWFGLEVTVTNTGIAAALVSFFGCKHVPYCQHAVDLDMYSAREKLCPKYNELMADASLMREGLNSFLKEHLDA